MNVEIASHTILLGVVTGIVLPLASNIIPIKSALGTSLRDALDLSRHGIDEMEVQFLRLENSGMNITQVMLSLALLINSVLTLYYIPKALLEI